MYLMGGKPGGVGLAVLAGQLVSCLPPPPEPKKPKKPKKTKKTKVEIQLLG